jgi:NitT/TauT family transport system substrate-binding protein
MDRFGRVVALLLAVVLIAGMVAGCAAEDTTTGDATEEDAVDDYTVKLGYYNCDHMLGAVVAKDAGIFDDLGLNVELTGNGNVPEAMAAGQMDVGYIGTEGLIKAREKGSPIFVAAGNHTGGSYYLVASNEIATKEDLVGKELGLAPDIDKTDAYWVRIAVNTGIPVEASNYQPYAMEIKDQFLALTAGQIDGYVTCDPWGSAAVVDGVGWIVGDDTHIPGTDEYGECCSYAMNEDFAAEHHDLAVKMVQAHQRALQFAYEHPALAAKIFADNYGVKDEVALMTIWHKLIADGRTLSWKIDEQNYQNEIDYAREVGTMDFEVEVSDFVITDIYDEADLPDFDTFIAENVDDVMPLGMSYEDFKAYALKNDPDSGLEL